MRASCPPSTACECPDEDEWSAAPRVTTSVGASSQASQGDPTAHRCYDETAQTRPTPHVEISSLWSVCASQCRWSATRALGGLRSPSTRTRPAVRTHQYELARGTALSWGVIILASMTALRRCKQHAHLLSLHNNGQVGSLALDDRHGSVRVCLHELRPRNFLSLWRCLRGGCVGHCNGLCCHSSSVWHGRVR